MAPSANPPSLPPTVEEAYRRKCIQLRARTREIEDENAGYRLRILRTKRQIQKLRLERAILLDSIAKRTKANVSDSEGSPSPPPTPDDKPLRSKRAHNHGKSGDSAEPPGFIHQGGHAHGRNMSPGSETYSHGDGYGARHANGTPGPSAPLPKPPKRPSNAFEIYCNDTRPIMQAKHREAIASGEFKIEQELARGWKDLSDEDKGVFQARYEADLAKWKEERNIFKQATKGGGSSRPAAPRSTGGAAKSRRSEPVPQPSRRSHEGVSRDNSHAVDTDDGMDEQEVEQEPDQDQDVEMADEETMMDNEREQEQEHEQEVTMGHDSDPETEVDADETLQEEAED